MNKILFPFFLILVFSLAIPAFAAKYENGVQQQTNTQQELKQSASPFTNQIENQIQNQGEAAQLQIDTREQENLGEEQGESLQNRNINAATNMSDVARKVQELLQINTTDGIGDQVRQVAQEQSQAQTQIQEQLSKLESKSQFAKFIIGPDFGVIRNLKTQLEQNQLRINQLEQLQTQISNQGDITMVQEAAKVLAQANISLQDRIAGEEQTKSLFGWLINLFAK